MFGRGTRETRQQAKQQMEAVGRGLTAHGYDPEGVTK